MSDGITAMQAQAVVGCTYRQLDHWVRTGWVTPTVDPGRGRSRRRQFAVDDVVRLGVLCHLGRSRRNLTDLGPLVGPLSLGAPFVVVDHNDAVTAPADIDELIGVLAQPGSYTVCDVAALRQRILAATNASSTIIGSHVTVDVDVDEASPVPVTIERTA